ncbi:MAG: hydantoinase/oxoprolinase family protein, partial [Anaerolineae bacterium]
ARYLSGAHDMVVVDMGGTTTDIALVRKGRPVLNREGAVVGGWRTMIEAVAIHTFGLGGDSEVQPSNMEWEGLTIGPRRVVPLSLLAHQYPAVLEVLYRQCNKRTSSVYDGQFVLRQRPLDGAGNILSPLEQRIWEATASGPVPLEQLVTDSRSTYLIRQAVIHLIEQGWLIACGFTPTDAAHILGYQRDWSRDAAYLGAVLWLRAHRMLQAIQEGDVEALCTSVLRQLTLQAGRAVVGVVAAEECGVNLETCLPARRLFVDHALSARNGCSSALEVSLMLHHTLVAIGAPVSTYYPPVAERLHTRLCIPPHAPIANAVGAVVGGITQVVRVQIRPLDDETFRVHLPDGIQDFATLEEAVSCATEAAVSLAEKRACAAGAIHVYVQTQRHDEVVNVRGMELFLGSEVIATASGRPRLAEH